MLYQEWNAGVHYEGADGRHDTDDMRRIFGRLHVDRRTDLSRVGLVRNVRAEVNAEGDTEYEDLFLCLNSALIEHFDVVSAENGIKWSRRK